jgi:hypothetical protein
VVPHIQAAVVQQVVLVVQELQEFLVEMDNQVFKSDQQLQQHQVLHFLVEVVVEGVAARQDFLVVLAAQVLLF